MPPISLLSEELRSIFLKRATLKGHQNYLPTLIPGQRPNLFFKNPPRMKSPKHPQPLQQLPISSFPYVHADIFSSCYRISPTPTPVNYSDSSGKILFLKCFSLATLQPFFPG